LRGTSTTVDEIMERMDVVSIHIHPDGYAAMNLEIPSQYSEA
jgi:hypothetical protein